MWSYFQKNGRILTILPFIQIKIEIMFINKLSRKIPQRNSVLTDKKKKIKKDLEKQCEVFNRFYDSCRRTKT